MARTYKDSPKNKREDKIRREDSNAETRHKIRQILNQKAGEIEHITIERDDDWDIETWDLDKYDDDDLYEEQL